MPNHLHGIIVLHDADVRAGLKPAPTGKRHGSEIVRGFKTFSSRHINQMRSTVGVPVWQRNYYEHVIRNEKSFNDICQYIINNPLHWADDEENPEANSIRR